MTMDKELRRKVEALCELCGDYCTTTVGRCLSFQLVKCKRCEHEPDDVELTMTLEQSA